MQRFSAVVQRSIQKSVVYREGISEKLVTKLPWKRVSPVIVRSFATASTSQAAGSRMSRFLNNPRFTIFTKSTAFSFGTLLCAGFWGYANNPKDSKDMKELKSKMEAIRKNYPNIRHFPVIII